MSGFVSVIATIRRLLGGGGVQVVGVGDSLMQGLTAPNTVTVLTALAATYAPLAGATFTNDGVAGARLDSTVTGAGASGADMVVRYAANVFPKRPAATGAPRAILAALIGANDFGLMSAAQAATWCTRWDAYCAQARTDGFTVVAFTVPPRADDAYKRGVVANEIRLTMNDYIRRSVNVDAVVDLAALFSLADMQAGVYVLGDTIHFSDTGNRLIGRALGTAVTRTGFGDYRTALPPASVRPTVAPELNAQLEAASITMITGSAATSRLRNDVVIGAGDFTVSWWAYRASGDPTTQEFLRNAADANAGAFGVLYDATGMGKIYRLPGASANWSEPAVFSDCWNHVAIRRSGATLDYLLNGALLTSIAGDASNIGSIQALSFNAGGKVARPRIYARALTNAELLADFRALSQLRGKETYALALEDGDANAGGCVLDLSGNAAHLVIADPAKIYRTGAKARRGSLKWTAVGSVVPTTALPSFPNGVRILSWTADVSVSGGGAVNIGHTNNGGQFFNTALGVGKNDLTMLLRYPPDNTQIYVNAAGYTITHAVVFEVL